MGEAWEHGLGKGYIVYLFIRIMLVNLAATIPSLPHVTQTQSKVWRIGTMEPSLHVSISHSSRPEIIMHKTFAIILFLNSC